jgi:ATP-binding cassette subfamily B protein
VVDQRQTSFTFKLSDGFRSCNWKYERTLELRHLIRPYGWQVVDSFLLFAMTALNLVIPKVLQQVIDIGLVQKQPDFLLKAALVILGIAVFRAVIPFGVRYLGEWIAAHIGYDLRNRMYNHIQYLPFSYHDHAQSGQLISRTIEDVRAIERFTGFSVGEIIRVGLLLVALRFYCLSEYNPGSDLLPQSHGSGNPLIW